MKTAATLIVCALLVALAACLIAGGIAGMVVLPMLGAALSFYGATIGCMIGAFAFDTIVGLVPELYADVMTDWYRVRNWARARRRLQVLGGGSTALSFQAYR